MALIVFDKQWLLNLAKRNNTELDIDGDWFSVLYTNMDTDISEYVVSEIKGYGTDYNNSIYNNSIQKINQILELEG